MLKRMLLITLFFLPLSHVYSITIGVTSDYPPLSMQADSKGNYFGLEIDVINDICSNLKLTCEFKPVIVANILPALTAGKIDFAIAAIIIPNVPMPGFVYSLPYLESYAQYITLADSKINSFADLRKTIVGVRRGTLGGGTIFKDYIAQMEDPPFKVNEYAEMGDLLVALSNKEIDAIFTNAVAVYYWYYNNKNMYKLVGNKIAIGNGYGIITTDKNAALMEQFSNTILTMSKDGALKKIYDKYLSP